MKRVFTWLNNSLEEFLMGAGLIMMTAIMGIQGNQRYRSKNQCVFNNFIHYFSPPLPNGFGRVTFSINGTKRLLKMIA